MFAGKNRNMAEKKIWCGSWSPSLANRKLMGDDRPTEVSVYLTELDAKHEPGASAITGQRGGRHRVFFGFSGVLPAVSHLKGRFHGQANAVECLRVLARTLNPPGSALF